MVVTVNALHANENEKLNVESNNFNTTEKGCDCFNSNLKVSFLKQNNPRHKSRGLNITIKI